MGRPSKYSEEFQREAVRLVETGKPLKQIARDLGISVDTLRAWRSLGSGASYPAVGEGSPAGGDEAPGGAGPVAGGGESAPPARECAPAGGA